MQFAKIHNVSEKQLRIILTVRFIMIVIITHYVYNPWVLKIREKYNRELSMYKLTKYLVKNPEVTIKILAKSRNFKLHNKFEIDTILIKYCTYDKRKRLNFNQLAMTAFV